MCMNSKSDHIELLTLNCNLLYTIQVSLAIRGGYVPGKSSTANTKTVILSLK